MLNVKFDIMECNLSIFEKTQCGFIEFWFYRSGFIWIRKNTIRTRDVVVAKSRYTIDSQICGS